MRPGRKLHRARPHPWTCSPRRTMATTSRNEAVTHVHVYSTPRVQTGQEREQPGRWRARADQDNKRERPILPSKTVIGSSSWKRIRRGKSVSSSQNTPSTSPATRPLLRREQPRQRLSPPSKPVASWSGNASGRPEVLAPRGSSRWAQRRAPEPFLVYGYRHRTSRRVSGPGLDDRRTRGVEHH